MVDTIEIGRDAETFTAYQDFEMPHIVVGGQGASMMGVRLRLTGTVPACLKQHTGYEDNGAEGHNDTPVKTYREPDGSYTTKPLWIPGYFPSMFSIHVDCGGKSQLVRLGPAPVGDM